jgi:hypothetical protein
MVFAESAATVIPAVRGGERWVAAASLIVLVAINIRPVRLGAAVLHAATWLKAGLLVTISLAAVVISIAGGDAAWPVVESAPIQWGRFGLALILVMGAYDGWQWAPQLAGGPEPRDRPAPGSASAWCRGLPRTNIPTWSCCRPARCESTLVTVDVASLPAVTAAFVAVLIVFSTGRITLA